MTTSNRALLRYPAIDSEVFRAKVLSAVGVLQGIS